MNELYVLGLPFDSDNGFIAAFTGLISEEKQQKLAKTAKKEDILRSLCSELLVRKVLLEKNIAIPPFFSVFAGGKPYITNIPGFYFSTAHSGNAVICAASTSPIGADTEKIREIDHQKLAKRFFLPAEAAQVKDNKSFFSMWTAKEAAVKLYGKHVADFKTFEVSLTEKTALFGGAKVFFKQYNEAKGFALTLASENNSWAKSAVKFTLDDLKILKQGE